MRRPRLLVVTSTLPARQGDGTPSFVWDLAEREAEEYETIVLAPAVPGASSRERVGRLEIRRFRYFFRSHEDLAHGAILDNLRSRRSRWMQVPSFFAAEALSVRRLIDRFRPDVMHVFWIVPQGLTVSLVARDVPWLLTSLGGDLYALNGTLTRRIKRWALRKASSVTVMTEDMRSRVIELGGDSSSTHVLPMTPELSAILATPPRPRTAGRLLFAGRLVEKKGLDVLLSALDVVDRPWTLDVVGDGPLREPLEARAKRFGARVRFLGTLDRAALAHAMAECSIFVIPSIPASTGDQDGLPVVLLEALAAGCAIVGSDLPGIAGVLSSDVSGLVVPAGDAGALGRALDRVLQDEELRMRLGASAQESARMYSAEDVSRRYLDLLGSIRNRPGDHESAGKP